MASSGKGSSSSGSNSYGSPARINGSLTVGGYAGKGKCGKGLYGMGGTYDGIGTGYGKDGALNNRLGGYLGELAFSYKSRTQLRDLYSKKLEAVIGVKTKYSFRDMIAGIKDAKLLYVPDFYRRRESLEKIMKPCPFCGRDSLFCGCRN